MLVAAGRSSRCGLLVLLFKGNFTIFLLLWAETWPWQWVSQTLGHKESTPSYNISDRKNPGLWVTLYSNATCHLQSPNPQPPPSTSSNPNMEKKKKSSIVFKHFYQFVRVPGEGNGNPLWYSCLENPRDGGAWWAAVYGVAQTEAT